MTMYRSIKKSALLLIITLILLQPAAAQNTNKKAVSEKDWGIGLANRSASIPYITEGTDKIISLVPMMFYEGERFFVRGIGGGAYFYKNDQWRVSALMRMHFVDLPDDYQNKVQPNNMDYGLRARYFFSGLFFADVEPLLDFDNMFSANLRFGIFHKGKRFMFNPYLEAKIKSTDYNSRYYGLTLEKVSTGVDYSLGIIADARVYRNLFLYGSAKITYLDKNASSAAYVKDKVKGEVYLGFGFANDPTRPRREALSIRPYLRLSQGFATPNSFEQVVFFNIKKDPYKNKLTSIFYGLPLTDHVFGIPLGLYITSGFVWHWASSVQKNAQEIVLAMKAYVTIHWPIRWRVGMAEGLSYINRITYIEQEVYDRKGYNPVHFLNYLDFSLDFNIGDIFSDKLKNIWIGYNVHHRSGIFEKSQQYGRVNVGSNYYSVYLQYDL